MNQGEIKIPKYKDAEVIKKEMDNRFYDFPSMLKDMKHMIDEIPDADIEVVQSAELKKINVGWGECSLCRKSNKEEAKYCNECGARFVKKTDRYGHKWANTR